jgi:hypothetical protein
MNYDDIMMMFYDSLGSDIWSCGINWGLSKIWYYLMLKSWPTKNDKRSKPESTLCYLAKYDMYLCLFIFFTWIKILNG